MTTGCEGGGVSYTYVSRALALWFVWNMECLKGTGSDLDLAVRGRLLPVNPQTPRTLIGAWI